MQAEKPLRITSPRLTFDVRPDRGIEIMTDRDVVIVESDDVLRLYAWLGRVLGQRI
jgi:hypothetical protein